jgi:cytosine/adenosine deaminase-related metal-dependent hydrolase
VLTHIGLSDARAVIVTVPDPRTARDITAAVRALAPQTRLLVRSRFQRACKELKNAGATTVVDEENTVGCSLAQEALTTLDLGQDAVLACALAGHSPFFTATPQADDSSEKKIERWHEDWLLMFCFEVLLARFWRLYLQ